MNIYREVSNSSAFELNILRVYPLMNKKRNFLMNLTCFQCRLLKFYVHSRMEAHRLVAIVRCLKSKDLDSGIEYCLCGLQTTAWSINFVITMTCSMSLKLIHIVAG